MGIYNDKLYIADIDTLVEVSLGKNALLKKRYIATQAKFLNDITVDQAGNVYVSDMLGNAIYRLANGRFELWLESKQLASPNGLHAESDRLVVGAWGQLGKAGFTTQIPGNLKTIALADKTVASLGSGEPVGNLDGVEADGRGNYYVTDWLVGKLLHIGPSGAASVLLELEQGSADIDYIEIESLLLIPMMDSNRLLAFKVIQP